MNKLTKESKPLLSSIDLTPTPEGMANIMIALIENNSNINLARTEISKAFRIAYAYWYPDKPEYKIPGLTINKEVK
jgi:hypothetical protein